MSRLQKMLQRRVARACKDFSMLEAGDRVMACVSGGKDSWAMLHLLREVQRRAPFEMSIIAVNLDQKQPGFPEHVIPEYCEREGYEHLVVEKDTYSVVVEKVPAGKTYCSLCSRLRRGIIYHTADKLGATKIALGHHRDDIMETLLLNVFYSGQIKAMPPKLRTDDGRHIVIRPLAYCAEEDLERFARQQDFPIIPCDLCGSQENLQRKKIKRLIASLHEANPKVKGNIFASLRNVRVSHLLDRGLWERCGVDLADAEPAPDPWLDALGNEGEGEGEGGCEPTGGLVEPKGLRISTGHRPG